MRSVLSFFLPIFYVLGTVYVSAKNDVYICNRTDYDFTITYKLLGGGDPSNDPDIVLPNPGHNYASLVHQIYTQDKAWFLRIKGDKQIIITESLSSPDFKWTVIHLAQKYENGELSYSIPINTEPTSLVRFEKEGWVLYDSPRLVTLTKKDGTRIDLEIRAFKLNGDVVYVIGQPYNIPGAVKFSETPASNDKNTFKLFEYNTYLMSFASFGKILELAAPFLGGRGIGGVEKPGVQARAALMSEAIGSNYDAIVLAEVWDTNARERLLHDLKKLGYKYATLVGGAAFVSLWYDFIDKVWGSVSAIRHDFRFDAAKAFIYGEKEIQDAKTRDKAKSLGFDLPYVNKSLEQPFIIDLTKNKEKYEFRDKDKRDMDGVFPWDVGAELALRDIGFIGNSGVMIVSKWPMVLTRECVYAEGSGVDKFAKKGCVYAKINKNGKFYHIFGTHLDTDNGIADKQIKWAKQFIDQQQIPANEPVLIAGDFNRAYLKDPQGLQMLKGLGAVIPAFKGSPFTEHDRPNALAFGNESPVTIDFVMYFTDHQQPKDAYLQVKKMVSKTPWSDNSYPDHEWYPMRNVYDLSDHYAMVGNFTF